MASFDRGETTLTLAKAFDILRTVGMIEEASAESAQDSFVSDAFARWRSLVDKLPVRSPGRFPDGWYRFDYELKGDLKAFTLREFERVLKKAETRHTGWPVFLMLSERQEFLPREMDGLIECWIRPEGDGTTRLALADPAHCDFGGVLRLDECSPCEDTKKTALRHFRPTRSSIPLCRFGGWAKRCCTRQTLPI